MNSYAASCCTCFRKASSEFETSASSLTADAPRSCRFAFTCSVRYSNRRQHKKHPVPLNRALFGSVPSVVDRCGSSKGLLLPRSNFVLLPLSSLLPHETTIYNTKPLRVSARSVSLRLAVLQTASFHLRQPSLRENYALTSLSSLSVPAAVLSSTVPAQLGTESSHN